jgi:hypothetical protein
LFFSICWTDCGETGTAHPSRDYSFFNRLLSRWHGKDKIFVEIPRTRLERSIELIGDTIADRSIRLPFE